MRERVIEDLVEQDPERFFGEKLKPVGRQRWLEGRRLDLLFEDSRGSLLLVEIKAGELQREHIGQAGEYFGLLKNQYPDRLIRVALLGTGILSERRRWLEAIGIEVYIVTEHFLLGMAEEHGIDPELGKPKALREKEELSSMAPVTRAYVFDESSYFDLVNQISDEHAKDKLAAIYAVAKKSPHLSISFSKAGSAEFSAQPVSGMSAKIMKVGISFKRRPPKAILTFYWKYALASFPPEKLEALARLVDELLGREKRHIYLNMDTKEGTFDSVDLHSAQLDGANFARFLVGLENFVVELCST